MSATSKSRKPELAATRRPVGVYVSEPSAKFTHRYAVLLYERVEYVPGRRGQPGQMVTHLERGTPIYEHSLPGASAWMAVAYEAHRQLAALAEREEAIRAEERAHKETP